MIRTLQLPLPPSTNNLYATIVGGRRIKSPATRAYHQEVHMAILVQWGPIVWQGHGSWEPYTERLAVGWRIVADRRRDLDNMLKVVLDSCQSAGVFADDRLIDAHIMRRRPPDGTPPGLVLLIGSLTDVAEITAMVMDDKPIALAARQ